MVVAVAARYPQALEGRSVSFDRLPEFIICLNLDPPLRNCLLHLVAPRLFDEATRPKRRSNSVSIFIVVSNGADMAGQSKEALIPPWGLAVAGATGAVIANALVYPLDM